MSRMKTQFLNALRHGLGQKYKAFISISDKDLGEIK
jgi:hypothetical protein